MTMKSNGCSGPCPGFIYLNRVAGRAKTDSFDDHWDYLTVLSALRTALVNRRGFWSVLT